jgi:steroid 5-alpha reductase family enzyme
VGINVVIIVAAAASALCFVLSLVTGDHSWVDRYWSIAPVVYAWIVAIATIVSGQANGLVILMAVLVTVWGARLTFNFARKGGYSGTEDYRWPLLRSRMKGWQFFLFNLFFIVAFQNALLLWITLPTWVAAKAGPHPLTAWEIVLVVAFVLALIGETVADQQQWSFHQRKARERSAGREVTPGFRHTGLWRFSRHPNYFFELAQWWLMYFLGVAAVFAGGASGASVVNVSLFGAVFLIAIFVGSTMFTEAQSAEKYPEFADYQRTTSAIVPFVPLRGGFDERVA